MSGGSTSSRSTLADSRAARLDISFLLNPGLCGAGGAGADDATSPSSRPSALPGACREWCGHHPHLARSRVSGGVTTGDSPDHEAAAATPASPTPATPATGAANTPPPDGHGDRPRRGYRFITRRRRGPSLKTNLQQRRGALASRAGATDFGGRECCKRLQCFRRAGGAALQRAIRATMLMGQAERKATLRGWLHGGVFVFEGRRVCSAFLANAFGFSRDLQRAVKTGAEREWRSGGADGGASKDGAYAREPH